MDHVIPTTGLLMVFALLALYSFTMSFLFVQSLEPLLVPWAILSQVRLWGLLLANSFLAWIPFFFSFFFFLYYLPIESLVVEFGMSLVRLIHSLSLLAHLCILSLKEFACFKISFLSLALSPLLNCSIHIT